VVGGGATLTEAFRRPYDCKRETIYSNFTGMNYNPKDNPAKNRIVCV